MVPLQLLGKTVTSIVTIFLVLLLVGIFSVQTASAQAHPYLYFNQSDVSGLNAKVNIPGSVSKQAFDQLETGSKNLSAAAIASPNIGADVRWGKSMMENALRYAIKGDQAAANRAISQIMQLKNGLPNNFANSYDPASSYLPSTSRGAFPHGMIKHGVWGTPIAVTYDLVYTCPCFSAAEKATVRQFILDLMDWYWWQLSNGTANNSNWYIDGYTSIGNLALSVRGDGVPSKYTSTYLNRARSQTRTYLDRVFTNGLPEEGPGYARGGQEAGLLFIYADERLGASTGVDDLEIYNLPEYYGYIKPPINGWFAAPYGDNNGGTYEGMMMNGPSMINIARKQSRVWQWFWDKIVPNSASDSIFRNQFFTALFFDENLGTQSPAAAGWPPGKFFPDHSGRGGYVAMNDSWNDVNNGLGLWFASRYDQANHQHFDPGDIQFAAYKEPFLYIHGLENYTNPNHGRIHMHNTVVVDDALMVGRPGRTGGTNGDESAFGEIKHFASGAGGTIAMADSKYAYVDRSVIAEQMGGSTKVNDITIADINARGGPWDRANRHVAMVTGGPNPPYVIVRDDIKRDNVNRKYEYRLLTTTPLGNISGNGTPGNPFVLDRTNADLHITMLQPDNFTGSATTYNVADPKTSTTQVRVLRATQNNTANGRFLSLLYPKTSGQPTPTVTSNAVTNGTLATIDWPGNNSTDVVLDRRAGTSVAGGGAQTSGRIAVVRTNSSNNVVSYIMAEGNSLSYDGLVYAQINGASGSVSASGNGAIVSVNAPGMSGFAVWAPNANVLYRNGVQQINPPKQQGYVIWGNGSVPGAPPPPPDPADDPPPPPPPDGDPPPGGEEPPVPPTPPPPADPVVNIFTLNANITPGQSTTISWSSSNTTGCSASGDWGGDKAVSGSQVVSPTETSTYDITCVGPAGSADDTVTVTVSNPEDPLPVGGGEPGGLAVETIVSTGHNKELVAENTRDGNLTTLWSARGDGQYVTYGFSREERVQDVRVAFYRGDKRTANIEIQASTNGATFSTVGTYTSCGCTLLHETFDIPDTTATHIRVVGRSNSENEWVSIYEVEFNGQSLGSGPPASGNTIGPIEAESATTITPPFMVVSDPNASGGRYVTSPNNQAEGAGGAFASFEVDIPETGIYRVWARVLAPTQDDNAFFFSVDGGQFDTWLIPPSPDWQWDPVKRGVEIAPPTNYNLSEGAHTFLVTGFEDGTSIDSLLITSDNACVPQGVGGACGAAGGG